MAKQPPASSASGELQKINEEIYKRNAELAVKNRALSLLYDLYDTATHAIDLNDRAMQMAHTIERSLQLPFFGVAFMSTQGHCLPLVATGVRLGRQHVYYHSSDKDINDDSSSHASLVTQTFMHATRRQHITEHTVERLFQITLHEWKPMREAPVQYFYGLPLRTNNKTVGFIIIGLDTPFSKIDGFELDIIENVRNVMAISLDNARNYHDLFTANLRLQELDKQKTEFLSIASHQLRTPLSIIKGYVELIKDGAYGAPSKELLETLSNIDETNDRLVKLVEEFLDISRIEQGRTKFSFAPHAIEDVVDSVLKELAERAKDKGLALDWTRPGIGQSKMDEEKVRHVVFNFIDNAIKYSETGTIRITAAIEEGGVTVRVKDNGLGFNKEDAVNFYQKFYRGENVKTVNVGGTGLGLYVCRKFIESHGGKVWAKSEGLGKGGEFGFWIPKNPPPQNESK